MRNGNSKSQDVMAVAWCFKHLNPVMIGVSVSSPIRAFPLAQEIFRHMRLWTCPDRRREQLPAKDEGPQVHSAPRTMELRMLLSGGPIHAKRKQASPNDGS
ncbi:hypothetical protein VTN49DRAFT_6671 [Thermomyces lanuginosus]|uniref:uncharacterized protein n=1 Tax=Thermomyces lanuginosus TaxID=5541 RepID=UPI003743ABE3